MEGSRPSGRTARTWRAIVQMDCQTDKLNSVYAMEEADKRRLKTTIGGSGQTFLLVPTHPGCPG